MRAPTHTSYNQAVEVPIEETLHYQVYNVREAQPDERNTLLRATNAAAPQCILRNFSHYPLV